MRIIHCNTVHSQWLATLWDLALHVTQLFGPVKLLSTQPTAHCSVVCTSKVIGWHDHHMTWQIVASYCCKSTTVVTCLNTYMCAIDSHPRNPATALPTNEKLHAFIWELHNDIHCTREDHHWPTYTTCINKGSKHSWAAYYNKETFHWVYSHKLLLPAVQGRRKKSKGWCCQPFCSFW